MSEKIEDPQTNYWTPPQESNLSLPLFDIWELSAFILYDDASLLPWQGALLWEYETEDGKKYPVIQLRKTTPKFFFKFYKKEEMFLHELVHAARFDFKQPLFEEMFAYQTSSSRFQRILGPLFLYPLEATCLMFASLLAPILSIKVS